METFVKSFSDDGNKSIQCILSDINRYAYDYDLEIISTSFVQFSFSDKMITECMVVFKKNKNE